jgi:AraC-like DNA-binding protein
MTYTSRLPTAALAPWVERIGVQHSDVVDPDHAPTRILPTGTFDLLFHYGDAFLRHGSDGARREPFAYVSPQRLAPIEVTATGRTGIVIVALHPWGLGALLGVPAGELAGTDGALDAHLPAPELDRLRGRLAAAGGAEARMALVEAWLLARLRPSLDPLARAAALRLAADAGATRIGALAEDLDVSRRQLDRRFRDAVGFAPKVFARVLRFQRAAGLLRCGVRCVEAATLAGYHDQAHMHREVLALAGRTPAALRPACADTPLMTHFNGAGMSRFYNTVYLG